VSLPVLFISKNPKKGVYYNPYFTINNPDPRGRLIFSIIISLRYNTSLDNVISQKGALPTHLGLKKGPLKG